MATTVRTPQLRTYPVDDVAFASYVSRAMTAGRGSPDLLEDAISRGLARGTGTRSSPRSDRCSRTPSASGRSSPSFRRSPSRWAASRSCSSVGSTRSRPRAAHLTSSRGLHLVKHRRGDDHRCDVLDDEREDRLVSVNDIDKHRGVTNEPEWRRLCHAPTPRIGGVPASSEGRGRGSRLRGSAKCGVPRARCVSVAPGGRARSHSGQAQPVRAR